MVVVINNNTTEKDVREFEKAFSKLSSKEHVKQAQVDYKYPLPAPDANPFSFPLVISTDDDIFFCILNVSAGYGGEGPHGTCKILEMCGFEFNRSRILSDSHGERVLEFFTK